MTPPPNRSSHGPAGEGEAKLSSASGAPARGSDGTDRQQDSELDESGTSQIREIVGVFERVQDFGDCVDELQSSGIDRARLSVLAGGPGVDAELRGRGFNRVQDLLDAPDLPLTSLIEPESLSTAQGALVSGFLYIGAAIGTGVALASGAAALVPMILASTGAGTIGAAIGAFLANRLGRERARDVESHLSHGGLALWVRVIKRQDEERVAEILVRHGGKEVHAHGVRDASGDNEGSVDR